MSNKKKALAITHVCFEDLGNLKDILLDYDYEIQFVCADGDLAKVNILNPDLVIILGGPIGVYDDDVYPFLTLELELIKTRIEADLPTLGICLGCQLIAKALNAKVYPGNNQKEIGWSNISLTKEGVNSPLVFLEETPILHWHGDTFDLPESCTHLAFSAQYENQAFSYGKNILALQFHPEVTAKGLEKWFIGHSCEINITQGITVSKLREDTLKYAQNLQPQAEKLWRSWLNNLC
jgi:GMP synthase (glutamine-hydrolysing)